MIGNSGSKYDYPNASVDNDVNSRNETIDLFETQLKLVLMRDVRYFDNIPVSHEQKMQSLMNVVKWYKDLIL
jgi:hypothetical protein